MQFETMTKLPDADSFNGSLCVGVVRQDIKSCVVLSEAEGNKGPDLVMALGYYAPAVAARLGLHHQNCLFFLLEKKQQEGFTENVYTTADIKGLEDDGFGRFRAKSVTIRALNPQTAMMLENYLGHPLTEHAGKAGEFQNKDTKFMATIDSYDGQTYYTRENGELKAIEGSLTGF